jgi:transcriptional regulator with XRE-family HTH domain
MPTYIVKSDVGDTSVGYAYAHKMELNERLKAARKAAGLTQQAVAEHFNISRVSVTQWELGQTRPDQDKFGSLAALYDVSLEWLMEEHGDGPKEQSAKRIAVSSSKFIRSRAFRFYVQEWREFMGVKVESAAKAAGMPIDEYQAFETYPINFGLAQIVALADEFGIRGDQFWFPPPAKSPQKSSERISKLGSRSISSLRRK